VAAHSLFLKDRFSAAAIRRVLAENFTLNADPCPDDCSKAHLCEYGRDCPKAHLCEYGWVVETMPGRAIAVEDGSDGTDAMPEDMIKMAARHLGSRLLPAKPKTRLVLIFTDATNDPDRRAVFAVGWAFAKHTRAVVEDHTGRQTPFPAGGWRG